MKNIMDEEQLLIKLKKLEMYQREEDIAYDEMKYTIKEMNQCYHSKNKDRFEQIYTELKQKFMVINRIHQNNIFVLQKNLEKYRNTKFKVENILNDADMYKG